MLVRISVRPRWFPVECRMSKVNVAFGHRSISQSIAGCVSVLIAVLAISGCASSPVLTAPTGETSLNCDPGGATTAAATVPPWAELIESMPDPVAVSDGDFRAAIIDTGLAWRVRERMSGVEMLLVPPGTFLIGCSASKRFGCEDHENPRHLVTLTKPFYLGRFEVTQAQWQRVMGSNPSRLRGEGDASNRPVDSVSWDDVHGFASETGLRLPTEAEWEYASRAGTETAFPNGSDDDASVSEIAWLNESALGGAGRNPILPAHSVGSKAPNALGFHDMLGNVMEWVNDRYDPWYYAHSPSENPLGPQSDEKTGVQRVIRGGGFGHDTSRVRSSYRNAGTSEIKGDVLGFRAARSP